MQLWALPFVTRVGPHGGERWDTQHPAPHRGVPGSWGQSACSHMHTLMTVREHMGMVCLRAPTDALVCNLGAPHLCASEVHPCKYTVRTPGCVQASERVPLVQQVLQEGPHVLVHFLRVALGDPVPHAWQDVGFQPAWHKTAADGPHQPLFKIGVLLPPQQQGGCGQLLGLQGEGPVIKTDRQAEGRLPPPAPPELS